VKQNAHSRRDELLLAAQLDWSSFVHLQRRCLHVDGSASAIRVKFPPPENARLVPCAEVEMHTRTHTNDAPGLAGTSQ
jgi:hypothetical protein